MYNYMYRLQLTKFTVTNYTALLWQKEASDKPPKSEKVVFLDRT